MLSGSNLVFMIAMKPLLGYVLHPVGVEMCREFCCQVTGKPFCVYSLTAFLCQVTRRKRLQVSDEWIILEIPTRHRDIYEFKTTSCSVHSRLHRSRTRGVKCVAVSSKPKYPLTSDCVKANPREPFHEEFTEKHPPAKGKSSVWPEDIRKDYSKATVGRETIYIKRIWAPTSWVGAKNTCEGQGAQLVKVDDEETLKEVTKLFNPFYSIKKAEVWIGLRDLCHNNTYVWLDGESPTYTKWSAEEATCYKAGEPHGKCVKMRVTYVGMEWLSASCASKHGYVCQLLVPDTTTAKPRGEIHDDH